MLKNLIFNLKKDKTVVLWFKFYKICIKKLEVSLGCLKKIKE